MCAIDRICKRHGAKMKHLHVELFSRYCTNLTLNKLSLMVAKHKSTKKRKHNKKTKNYVTQ